MDVLTVTPAAPLRGAVAVPGDKSITHRALILGAIARGTTRIRHGLEADDCRATQAACAAMGVPIRRMGDEIQMEGVGLQGLAAPAQPLDCGNSGTTMRLLLGVLAAQPFTATLIGDPSLSQRPMARVTHLLRTMGAAIEGGQHGNFAPLTIRGGPLNGLTHRMTVPSAQVKSALLLAGLAAQGETVITEPILTRDHTERMLAAMGGSISVIGDPTDGRTITLQGGQALTAQTFEIPGDLSSAAFWCVAAAVVPGSSVTVRDVGLNPTRTGVLEVLQAMGARVTVTPSEDQAWEPRGTVTVSAAPLRGTTIAGPLVPRLIDELPILMVAAAAAHGRTTIRDVAELRVKETDRLCSMVSNLTALGARVAVEGDTVLVDGPAAFRAGTVPSFGDHRTAMAMAVAGLTASGPVRVEDTACIRTSYPEFSDTLRALAAPRP